MGTWWLRRKYLHSLSRNPSDLDQSLSKTAGSFPMGFTSQIAGGGIIPAGSIGRGKSLSSWWGPPHGEPGRIGGGIGEGGLDPPFRKDCRVDSGWSCVLVTILAMRNGSVCSCSGMLLSLNPSGSYSNDVVDRAGNVVIFWGELSWVLVASFSPSSRSFLGSKYTVLKRLTPNASIPSVGSHCL